MTTTFTKKLVLLSFLLLSFLGFSQEYNSFEIRYQDNIKGDLIFISNQILNRDGGSATTTPLDGYNNLNTSGDYWPSSNRDPETGGYYNYNDRKNMRYVNVDPSDGNFSSSSATLNFPNVDCNRIRYAGLYWSAIYPRDNASDPSGTARQHPINQIKLRVPGGAYTSVTADEILFDGLTVPALAANAPYAAYADVTNLLTPLTNPTGVYTVADIPAVQGNGISGGSSGGWTLVIVYENPTITGKLITTFDGFAKVSNNPVNINYNGFTTIPSGIVNANIGAAALEGDFRISGDFMRIRAASNPTFTTMSNATNPANNFFNSNITLNGVALPGRNPSSANTLGYDTDMFRLNNWANSIIPNNETNATFQFDTSGDHYYPFFNSFNIEIIEPDIVLEKKVEDISGVDITGLGVNLGQTLDYVLSFKNIGNDNGTAYTIRDVLPINVTLDETSYVLPPGMGTPTYDAATRTVIFTVPDALIVVGQPTSSIRMRVQVAQNCYDFIDACTDLIQNLAYSTYEGVVNDNQITDDPSVTDFNTCGFVIPGATNFLLDDLDSCNFTRTVQLCGDNLVLDAGDNFDSYVWIRDDNNNGQIDASDTVLNDGDPDNDPSTLLITELGTYIVDKIVADPCKGFKEIMIVERYGSVQTNPIVEWFNNSNSDADVTNDVEGEIVQCTVDGDQLPKIFLCGTNDSQLIETNINDFDSISWELLDENSCTAATADCANKNASCTWNQVGTGSDYTATTAGKYRVVIRYDGGCFSRFYFDVFQNVLDITYTSRDIICTTDGRINITNLGSNYGFQLIDITNNSILVPFSANNGPDFSITTNGQYRVDVVQLDGNGNPIDGACVFSTPEIGIRNRNFQVDIATTPSNCNAQGTIKIDILNVEPNYTYILSQTDGTLIDDETAQTNNTHTFNVNAGDYIIEIGTVDGCSFTQTVTVASTPDPVISAVLTNNIGCSAGSITMTASGGYPNPDYGFAIWSKDSVSPYTTIADIPGDAYQVETAFTFGWRDTDNDTVDEYFTGEDGIYVFVVVDANGCSSLSNPVTITDNGAMTISITDDSVVSCSGGSDASITVVPLGGIGPYTYILEPGNISQTTATFVGLSAGDYSIFASDSSGCTVELAHTISQPFPLSASAGVSRDASCDPAGAQVRVTNVVGGYAPYEYSFDGGGSYGATSIAILPAGTYTVVVRDATLCTFPMPVIVNEEAVPPTVFLTPEVNYSCDGGGTITASPNIGNYNYTYELDGVLNTPPNSNVFPNVAPGTYTVRTNYIPQTPPTPSLLLSEDFGSGLTIPSPNTNGYSYEDQTGNSPGDSNSNINDFEYSVTSSIVAPFGSWINPDDHTTGTKVGQGRYLVMNVGTPTPTQIIYAKQINDIIPNQNLEISLYVMNLLKQGRSGLDPNLTVELRQVGTGTVIQSIQTGAISKNTGVDDWRLFSVSFNPGTNTSLEFVIRSEINGNGGNDFALDDIEIFQTPEVCEQYVETPVTVVAGNIFASSGINSTNVSCNGLSDGTITFEVENFDTITGFDYSLDGGTNYINATTSPITTPAIFNAGSHTVLIRKANETTCTAPLTVTITAPNALEARANITTVINCTNGGATITASAIDGTPTYTYQLENTTGTAIATYDFATNGTNTVFTGIAPGAYIVRVRDHNNCEDPIDVALTVAPTNAIVFDLTTTACYSGANDASILVNVTNGNGNYTFSINGGPAVTPTPAIATTHTFDNLANGTYTINVRDGSSCVGTLQTVTINSELTVSATAPAISACATSTNIAITANGGDANYVYAAIPTGNTITDGDFSTTNPVSVSTAGAYDIYVRDNSGATDYCSDSYTITITKDLPIDITVTPTAVSCFGDANGAISISVNSGGSAPFVYSIDNGATYVSGNSFVNLSPGTYPVRVRDANNCETIAQDIDITEPTALIAFSAVTQLVECNPTLGAEVRITNAGGGTLPYEYSFNNGLSFVASPIGHLAAGNHVLVIRDANLCAFSMTVTVEPQPTEPNFTDTITYDCTGEGTITLSPDNTGFDYTYLIDGVLNSPSSSNIFTNVSVGTHTITMNYISNSAPVNSILLLEDFGSGASTSITEIDPLFCFEPQDGSPSSCASFGTNTHIQDGEYSVAHTIVNPYSWLVPNEQSTDPNGRYLAINIGGVAGANGVMYAKRNIEVIPNRDITISLDVFNLKYVGSTGADADLDIQLVNGSGTVIASITTGNIPKSTDPDIWEYYSVTLNPGAETNLDIVIRTNGVATMGNDIVIDNITAFQAPEQCPGTDTVDLVIEDGHAFEASITAFENLDCNADNSGTITIIADNFGAGGFEYSLDATTFVGPFTTEEQITGLAAQAYTITIRDVDNPIAGCTITLNQTLTEPDVLEASASITTAFTCNNTGATITASEIGGTPTYEYQLEDDAGGVILAYQASPSFTNLVAGDYIIRVKDANDCTDAIDTEITVVAPASPVFTVTPTACYSGANNASILVDVTTLPGNGGFQFSIDSGAWITPTPVTATSYTFTGLTNASYTIDVRDAFGCSSQLPVTINPQLVVSVDALHVSGCADGLITVNATGGIGTLLYAVVPANTSPTGLFTTTNTLTVTNVMATANTAGYDIYVRDNNNVTPYCSFTQEDLVINTAIPLTTTSTATNPECFDGLGAINATVVTGQGPFTYQLIDLSPADGIDYGTMLTNITATTNTFAGVGVGDYQVTILDVNLCSVTTAITTISNATEITADITPILPANCNSTILTDFGFEFTVLTNPTGTVEYSADGGTTWQASNELRGYASGTAVFPSIRVTLASGTVCQKDFDRYIIPFPLDDLDITLSAVILGCNDLQVTVEGSQGDNTSGYEYTYTDNLAGFIPGAAVWTAQIPLGTSHTFANIDAITPQLPGLPLLVPGRTYRFYVRDGSGCVRQSNVDVNEIPLINLPIAITTAIKPSCNGAANGEIVFTLSPVTSYSHMRWEVFRLGNATPILVSGGGAIAVNVLEATTITAAGLSQGDYYVHVTQVNGATDACIGGSANIFLNELSALNATANHVRDISCNLPGLIEVTGLTGGGGSPYTFDVTGPLGFTAITGLTNNPIQIPINSPTGDYTITVNDQYNCPLELAPITMSLSPNPTISVSQNNCSTPIQLVVTGTSAAGNLRYAIVTNGAAAPTSYLDNAGVFDNVSPGSYDAYVMDGNGCTNMQAAFIVHPVLSANVSLTKLLDCTATPDATIAIEALDGSGSYNYSITNTAGVTAITNILLPSNPFVYQATAAGDYTITIHDNNTPNNTSCDREFTITVPAAVTPVFTETHVDVTCNGDIDGSITLTETTNGINPLTYTISPAAGSFNAFTNTFEDLPIGTYAVTGRGTNNCPVTITDIIIGQPDAITNINTTVVEFLCTTANNSNFSTISIDAGILGGSNNYVRYQFINDQGTVATDDDVIEQDGSNVTYTETDITGGTYIINVFDDNNCVGSTTATILPYVSITDPTVSITKDVTCNPGDDAEITIGITVTPTAGATDLSYSVSGTDNANNFPNQASNAFTGIGVGNYLVTVTNHLTGCFVQTTFEIKDPNTFEITTTTTDVVCFGDNGTVSFTISDVINPYIGGFTWQIYNSQGTVAIGDDTIIPAATGAPTTVGPTAPFPISAGEYRVVITQDSDPSCVNDAFFTIAGPSTAITANTQVTPITCLGANGVIEIIDVLGGWGDYEYYVGTTAPTAPSDFVPSPRFENRIPGTYQAWIKDINGCEQEVQSTIVLADPTPISATLQLNQANCPNYSGEIEVIGTTGGQGSNYTYQLIKDGIAFGTSQNTTIFSGLDAGSYTVRIDDQWNCTFTTLPLVLYNPIAPLATIVKTIDCSTTDPGGQITITQTGGSGAFNYAVEFPDGSTPLPGNTTGIFTALTDVGVYEFTITDQAVGHACPVTITQELLDEVLPIISIDSFTNVTCNLDDDGTITVSTTDTGVSPYSFEIISGSGSSIVSPILPTTSTSTSAIFTGLEGSATGITYTVRARGSNNCTVDITETIMQPDAITSVNATVQEFLCTAGNNSNYATITIDAGILGGSGNYVRYEFINTDTGTTVQDGSNVSYTETNFIGGNYRINVYDDNSCSAFTTAIILPFASISDATVTTLANITCAPGNDEEIQVGITVTPASATPTITYEITGTNVVFTQTNTTGLFSGLGIGAYAITITNQNTGCIVNTTHEVIDPDVIRVVATKLTDEECLNNGVDDGSFSITITEYTGNYSYQVFDNNDNPVVGAGFSGTSNTTTPLIISNLTGGVYYVKIIETDAPYCEEDSNRITILAPEFPISATISEQASPSCTDDKGSILIDPEGGVAPYTIVLTNTTTTQSYTQTNINAYIFPDLSGGSYDITITDAQGCPITDTITLVTPDALVPTITATTLACFNGNSASVTASVNIRNVTPNYLYQLNRYDATGSVIVTTSANQTSSTFIGLNAGYYSITVNDDVSCSEETPVVQIINPTQVEAQLIRTSPLTCATGVELLLTVSGGAGTYEYSQDAITWYTMTGTTVAIPNANVTGPLSAGTYRYFVRDAANTCTSVQSNEITEDPIDPLILTVDSSAAYINCNGDNTATIFATATGGLGNYMFALYNDIALSTPSRIAGPQNIGEFANLPAGTYYVNVLSEDCNTPAQEVIITEPLPLDYSDTVTNALCFGEENGSITVTLTGGSGRYQYAISPNLSQFDTENTFDELAAGDYTIIAQDEKGCFIELQYTITEPEVLDITISATPEICAGDQDGTINLVISGGTAPYSTRLSTEGNFVQDRDSFTELSSGAYIIFIRDTNGCETDTAIVVDSGANLNATITPVYECTENVPDNYINITLEDATVTGDVMYALDSVNPDDLQLNPDFRNIVPGTHYIAIAHSNGCVRTITFEIENFEPLALTLEQNSINEITATATGGKENYTFYLEGEDNGSDNTFIIHRTDTYVVTVIDDNGCEVQASIFMEFIDIELPNFFTPDGDGLNDVWTPRNQEAFPKILTIIFDRYGREVYRIALNTPGWDGLYNKSELPTGDYWYVIKLRGEDDDREFVGHFTLYR